MRTFRSDNNAGICPEALAAIRDAASDHVTGYGDDHWTDAATGAFREIFGDDIAIFFVATGTAANTLAIAALTEPWQNVVCHRHSHWNDDESTAPERVTHCRLVPVDTVPDRITVDDVERIASFGRGDVHQPQPGVITISNTTEFGTVYDTNEIGAICDAAHDAGYRVHMDGARFANAVASLQADPRELTVDAGIDALSFGGTKNGMALGEAVVFFPQGDRSAFERAIHAFPYHRKGTGHLLSKHRFVSAPFARVLQDGTWLDHAEHANAMARRLAGGLMSIGIEPAYPVKANGVFLRLPDAVDRALQERGHGYYPFGDPDEGLVRLMCSFDTDPADVDALVADAEVALSAV